MPPRYVYWTILIDDKPTAFRAQKQEDLLPTFKQLSRANPNIVMKWFARGRLWENPEQAQWALTNVSKRRHDRGPMWRPGAGAAKPAARPGRDRQAQGKARPDRRDNRKAKGGRPPRRDRPPKRRD